MEMRRVRDESGVHKRRFGVDPVNFERPSCLLPVSSPIGPNTSETMEEQQLEKI